MAVAIILLLVAVASVLFHLFSPWWWTPIASNWSYIDHTITLTFWITGAVYFAIIAFMADCSPDREPPFELLVFRLVGCLPSLLVLKAEDAIGHERDDREVTRPSDPERQGDRVVDVAPV